MYFAMEYLSWDLAIFSRAIAYPNLSSASDHVGLSQPQISRIVAKLEAQFDLTLLDRETRRKATWTAAAYRLAEIYTSTFHNFQVQVSQLASGHTPEHLRVGALEGLLELAMGFCYKILSQTKVMVVELFVLDTSPLEERFQNNELDLVFSIRAPGHKKWSHRRELGWQSVERVDNGELQIFSCFEYASVAHKGRPKNKAFVSNSLRVRERWIEQFGGIGTLPSQVRPKKTGHKDEVPVMVIAHDHMPDALWRDLEAFLIRE